MTWSPRSRRQASKPGLMFATERSFCTVLTLTLATSLPIAVYQKIPVRQNALVLADAENNEISTWDQQPETLP